MEKFFFQRNEQGQPQQAYRRLLQLARENPRQIATLLRQFISIHYFNESTKAQSLSFFNESQQNQVQDRGALIDQYLATFIRENPERGIEILKELYRKIVIMIDGKSAVRLPDYKPSEDKDDDDDFDFVRVPTDYRPGR